MYKLVDEDKNLKLLIEHDENVGFYLYVYDLDSKECKADYLLDELEDAFDEANELFSVDKREWKIC